MTMEEEIIRVAAIIGALGVIGGVFTWVYRTMKAFGNGIKCMLRASMLNTYYKNHDKDTWRQYEAENFALQYEAYKALGGNSFIDTIKKETESWEVAR